MVRTLVTTHEEVEPTRTEPNGESFSAVSEAGTEVEVEAISRRHDELRVLGGRPRQGVQQRIGWEGTVSDQDGVLGWLQIQVDNLQQVEEHPCLLLVKIS